MTDALTGLSVRVLRAVVVVTAVSAVLVAGWWVVQARAEATEASVQVCVGPDAGLRLADTCRQNETPLQLATADGLQATDQRVADLEAANAALEARVAALEGLLAGVTRGEDTFGRDTLRLSGLNLQLDNGHEEAVTATSNGLGNLIIGHNTLRPAWMDFGPTTAADRSGSHYIIVGDWHHWTGSGGYVAGNSNTASGSGSRVSWVSGGSANRALNGGTVLGGGSDNTASGRGSFVLTGGADNGAYGGGFVFAGDENGASARGFVFGGGHNYATGEGSAVFGGDENSASNGAMVVNSWLSEATNAYVFGFGGSQEATDGSFWVGRNNLAE